MSSGSEVATGRDARPVVPTGNTFDKYGSRNPAVRRLMAGFERALDELFAQAAPVSVLDVGCGEGVLTARWAQRLQPRRVVGVDLEDSKLRAEWSTRRGENLEFRSTGGGQLPFGADEFDLVAAIEALEHIPAPELAVAEMARVARRHLLVSVPREPLWRILNVSRGAYVRRLGNTPGHVNHWSKHSFVRLLGRHGEVVQARTPFPWTMLLVRVG
jgi:2-polyprenyl-3-methyl-5-hydroxy-6-metoxy-1,4-benzoquinol methylase